MKQDQIVIYRDENNAIQLEVRMDGETKYLVKGYVVNERIRKEQLGELRQLVQVVVNLINQRNE